MLAGKGTKDQGPAHKFLKEDKDSFEMLINLLTEATIFYLSKQIDAGAEVIKIFDSWAGSLKEEDFVKYAVEPVKKIITALNKLHPDVPIIAFPRGAGLKYIDFANETGANCIAIDHSVDPEWAAKSLQIDSCIQGNLNPKHMVTGGKALLEETTKILDCFSNGPHIFNLGHGITPDGKPENLQLMIDRIRSN
jgi:uroporphyrinogen decarboxylase